jgi:hypothetical protein
LATPPTPLPFFYFLFCSKPPDKDIKYIWEEAKEFVSALDVHERRKLVFDALDNELGPMRGNVCMYGSD